MEGGVEVEGAMGEDESAGVDEAKGEVEGGGGEWGGGEVEGEGLARRVLDAPLEELGAEVGRAGGEDEAVGGEYGGRAFVVCGGEGAGEGYADIGVESGTPHEDEVFAELVDTGLVCAMAVFWVLLEEEFELFGPALASVEILELISEDGGVDGGG